MQGRVLGIGDTSQAVKKRKKQKLEGWTKEKDKFYTTVGGGMEIS